ncbi:MAG: TRAP transporter small permease [Cardiobacteriaceae bacterium]|nr:TRAP transporter small permease [Cardiobacteriaceae bacterium]
MNESDVKLSALPWPERLAAVVRRVNGYVLTVLAFLLVACVVWQVISRYVSAKPSTVTDELARFTFMWIGLLGAAQASAHKQHLAIDLLAMKLRGGAKKALNLLIECAIIAFASLVMIWGGWSLAAKTFANQQVTPALQWPMGYVYMVVPVAGVLMVFFALVAIHDTLRHEESAS